MIDFAINIETIYPGMEVCEKIERVSAAGFRAIEFWSWHDKDLADIRRVCHERGVSVKAFSGTSIYSLCDRAHSQDCIDWVRQSLDAAKMLGCDKLILFPNHFTPNGCADFRDRYSHTAMLANITHTLTRLAPVLEENGVTALIEPLNNWGDDAGMSLTTTAEGADIVRAVGSERVGLLCDVFHMQLMHGNLLRSITDNLDVVKYIHLADAPDRHEPGTGEINFDFLLRGVAESGYAGTVCFEYFPAGDTDAGFPAVKKLCDSISK